MKKLFALLCVIAILGALCIPAMAETGRVAVAAQVPEDWTTPYLYTWGNDGEEVAWPGVPMVLIDDWYVAYKNEDNANVIINNGSAGPQTSDLTVTPGLPVCVFALDITNVEVDVELPVEVPAESELPKPAGDTVHAKTPADWTTAYLYAWGDNGDNGGWPGVEMTKDSEGNWVAELTPGFKNVIVTASDSGPQTIDLAYKGGEAWVHLTEAGADGKFGAYIREDGWGDPPVIEYYVAGSMNEWNAKDEAYKMTENDDGTYALTLPLTAGDYSLKVTKGSWDEPSFGGSGADGNYEFALQEDCDVTVTFDGVGTVDVKGPGIAPPPVTYYIAGSMNEWNVKDEAYKMTDNGNGTYSYTFDVTPGDYSLKVTNGTWDGTEVGGEGENADAEGNYFFNASDEGKVTIYFDGAKISHEFGENTTTTTTGDTPPTPPTPNTGLIIGIVATAVILIGGGAAVFFILKKKD